MSQFQRKVSKKKMFPPFQSDDSRKVKLSLYIEWKMLMDGMQIFTIMENLLFPEVEYFIILQIFANIYKLWRTMMPRDGIRGETRHVVLHSEETRRYYKCCFPILNSIRRVTKNWLNELFSISGKTNNSSRISNNQPDSSSPSHLLLISFSSPSHPPSHPPSLFFLCWSDHVGLGQDVPLQCSVVNVNISSR